MKKVKIEALMIDFAILLILGLILMFGIYTLYSVFPSLPRLIAFLIIILMIPVFWGTIICSILGKKTIGNRIAKNKKSNNL